MLRALNIGWLHPPSFVWSNRRSMRRLRLFSCPRILAFTRNPSWLRSPRKQSTFLDSENTEGFRVFQGISPPTSGEFAWLGTRALEAVYTGLECKKHKVSRRRVREFLI